MEEYPYIPELSIPNCERCSRENYCGDGSNRCLCFGEVKYKDWNFDYSKMPEFKDAEITILKRGSIKCCLSKDE
jgi:hypothetical protein